MKWWSPITFQYLFLINIKKVCTSIYGTSILFFIYLFLCIALFSFMSMFLCFMHTNLLWRWQKLNESYGFSSSFRYFDLLFCGEVLNYKIGISIMASLGNFYPYGSFSMKRQSSEFLQSWFLCTFMLGFYFLESEFSDVTEPQTIIFRLSYLN